MRLHCRFYTAKSHVTPFPAFVCNFIIAGITKVLRLSMKKFLVSWAYIFCSLLYLAMIYILNKSFFVSYARNFRTISLSFSSLVAVGRFSHRKVLIALSHNRPTSILQLEAMLELCSIFSSIVSTAILHKASFSTQYT
jgi:hypothetical protein